MTTSKGLTAHQFNIEKEKREQQIRGLEIDKLDRKVTIKQNELKGMDVQVKQSEVALQLLETGLEGAQINLNSAKLNNLIAGDSLKALTVTRGLKQQVLRADIESLMQSVDEKKLLLAQGQESLNLRLGDLKPSKLPELSFSS